MKKLVATAVLGFLTVGSLALTVPFKANAATSESTAFNKIFPENSTKPESNTQLSKSSQEQQVAYSTCYTEYYYDGSYAWVCW